MHFVFSKHSTSHNYVSREIHTRQCYCIFFTNFPLSLSFCHIEQNDAGFRCRRRRVFVVVDTLFVVVTIVVVVVKPVNSVLFKVYSVRESSSVHALIFFQMSQKRVYNLGVGSSIKDIRKISAKIDPPSPLSAFVRIGPTSPTSPLRPSAPGL